MTRSPVPRSLSVVGLGKLGSPLAAVLAAAGHQVIGTDVDRRLVEAVAAGRAPVVEPGLQQAIDDAGDRLSATPEVADAVAASEATFVVVPTPSTEDGGFSLEHVLAALVAVGAGIRRKGGGRHLVTITSTVLPGATDGPLRRVLEEAAGRPVGPDLGLCYSPEFIALGSVVADLRAPDFVLVGETVPWAGCFLEDLWRGVLGPHVPVRRMTATSAELVKIAVNTYVTTKISFANLLGELCDRLGDCDVDTVTEAVGLDRRVGNRYLRAATGYGGPCFPRDNKAMQHLARSLGTTADIAEATDRINRRQADRLLAAVLDAGDGDRRVAVLGLSYKAGTPVTTESAGVELANRLARAGFDVVAHDPLAGPGLADLDPAVHLCPTVAECLARSAVAVVTTPWPEYRDVVALAAGAGVDPPVIVDCWGLVEQAGRRPVEVRRPGVPGGGAPAGTAVPA